MESGLEDINQTAIYIPYEETDADDLESYSLFPDRDLPEGYTLRLTAYRAAWSKCLDRVQELIRALHDPLVDKVVDLVNSAYTDMLPGSPYTELPVISVAASGIFPSIFDEVASRLEDKNELFDDNRTHFVAHLFPAECSTVTAAMKALITGFVDGPVEETDPIKRKSTTSLAGIDINLLRSWFDAVRRVRGAEHNEMRLVVILHDFEQFETLVIQDFFEICRLIYSPKLVILILNCHRSISVPCLPLVFVLSLSSPPSPSYLHATFPRSMLSRLQVRNCSCPTSQDVLHEILLKTFFDLEFDPHLMFGPSAIDFLVDFSGRHTGSLDGLMSIMHVIHLKHFEDPLTAFHERIGSLSPEETLLSDPASFSFLDSIFSRVQDSSLIPEVDHAVRWLEETLEHLLSSVRTAREIFQERLKLLRVAFRLLLLVQRIMASFGHKTDKTLPEMMVGAIRGRLGTTQKYLCSSVKKLQPKQLDDVLSNLRDFFTDVPDDVQKAEEKIISCITMTSSVFGRDIREPRDMRDIATFLGDQLSKYFQLRLVSLEESPLCDIWYTASTPFPSDLLNPSLRASIFSALLHPQDYGSSAALNEGEEDELLLGVPDASILFRGYLESGKMINVYDWFESFKVILEAQKRRVMASGLFEDAVGIAAHRKGKQRQMEAVNAHEEEGTEEALEKWKLEIQAQFIRALHELDYVGLIKHTGRKADHVSRTVFDVVQEID
ncbi:origin recognition complex subunit 3 N-terminus-domain-containing protein [Phlebopus sp. FC_14]|nr:origin recognition complex subunit 3 N-terminus-domain-containing protein [Phlebopus sp. FC_14]